VEFACCGDAGATELLSVLDCSVGLTVGTEGFTAGAEVDVEEEAVVDVEEAEGSSE